MNIEHIAMYFEDLKAGRDFFIKYFDAKSNDGYHNQKTNFQSYFLTFDDGARLEIMHKPYLDNPEKSLSRTGYAHVAFSLGTQERVDALTNRLALDGYRIISGPRITGDGYYESCIVGIEDNQIELTI